jgi:hypothetical protein
VIFGMIRMSQKLMMSYSRAYVTLGKMRQALIINKLWRLRTVDILEYQAQPQHIVVSQWVNGTTWRKAKARPDLCRIPRVA